MASAPSREVMAGALDDTGRARPAGLQGLVIAEELALVPQVADARISAGPVGAGEAGGVGLGGDRGGPVAAAGQDRESPGRDPVLGGGVPGFVEAPCRTLDQDVGLRGTGPAR